MTQSLNCFFKFILAIFVTGIITTSSIAEDMPFKKATPPAEEKILDIKSVEKTNPKKLATPDDEEAEKLAKETVPVKEFNRDPKRENGDSGLPIPRFVSLKSGEVNGRSGPGETYPIKWVYQRKNLPVEITAEFKLWRRIRDIDGDQTWVHQAMLRGERFAVFIHDSDAYNNEDNSTIRAKFRKNVQVKLVECKSDQCEVEYGNVRGWTKKSNLWGVYDDEKFD